MVPAWFICLIRTSGSQQFSWMTLKTFPSFIIVASPCKMKTLINIKFMAKEYSYDPPHKRINNGASLSPPSHSSSSCLSESCYWRWGDLSEHPVLWHSGIAMGGGTLKIGHFSMCDLKWPSACAGSIWIHAPIMYLYVYSLFIMFVVNVCSVETAAALYLAITLG